MPEMWLVSNGVLVEWKNTDRCPGYLPKVQGQWFQCSQVRGVIFSGMLPRLMHLVSTSSGPTTRLQRESTISKRPERMSSDCSIMQRKLVSGSLRVPAHTAMRKRMVEGLRFGDQMEAWALLGPVMLPTIRRGCHGSQKLDSL